MPTEKVLILILFAGSASPESPLCKTSSTMELSGRLRRLARSLNSSRIASLMLNVVLMEVILMSVAELSRLAETPWKSLLYTIYHNKYPKLFHTNHPYRELCYEI